MGRLEKILSVLLKGTSDANIDFNDLCWLLERLHFRTRVKGSHHIFWKEDIPEIINLQPNGSKAKVYQVKQVRTLIIKYKLGESGNE
jgi:hypothetical protein